MGLSPDDFDGLLARGGGEACVWQPMLDGEFVEDVVIRLGPANASDFEEDATRDGTTGEPQDDFKGAALWFPGETAGTLSLIEPTPIAYALLEVTVGSPDLDNTARLDRAKVLASSALARLTGQWPPADRGITLRSDLRRRR